MSEQGEGKKAGSAAKNIARSLRRRRLPNVDGGRPFAHQVMASAEEEAAIQARARVLGVSVPRLLLESALTPTPAGSVTGLPPADKVEICDQLYGLARLIRQIGTNVNQIAKAANATGEVGEDLAATTDAVRRTLVRIDAAMLDVSR
jgi:hypothetical protein